MPGPTEDEWQNRANALDAADPLGHCRALFDLPKGVIYLDGNSLGPLPRSVRARLERTVNVEWGKNLIRSWNDAGWVSLPSRVGDKIAPLIGAPAGSVVATDSTSVNLFKVLSAAVGLRPERRKIISERSNFPTDLYMAEGLAGLVDKGHELVLVDSPDEITVALDDNTAVLMLTHVNYRTGAMLDMAGLTSRAHSVGAMAVWDLAHSAGAVPVDLTTANADFAVGCSYKFLNGGPGAPAFLYVAPEHQNQFSQPLSGWFGHAAPFAFEPHYQPVRGVARYLCGTPSVLSISVLDDALELWQKISMTDIRTKSMALSDFFIAAVETRCAGHGLELVTPRDKSKRGSQVSFNRAEGGFAIMQCLINNGVIGDFRSPGILRFGIAPLYLRFTDVLAAAQLLAEILNSGEWDQPIYHQQGAVT